MSAAYCPPAGPVQCLYWDVHLLVVAKPFGLLSVPGRGVEKADCLAARLSAQLGEVLVVHRLDMETSGLMVFARTAEAQSTLSRAFAERTVEKRYVAVVAGELREDAGTVDLPLISDWPNRPRQKVDHEIGKTSQTHWQVIAREGETSRVALTPITGRSHQLRVHMAALGHPILGDSLYASSKAQAAAPRLLLHAETLGFQHPVTGAAMRWSLPAPF